MPDNSRFRTNLLILVVLLLGGAVLPTLVAGAQSGTASPEREPLLFRADQIDTGHPPAGRRVATTATGEALYLVQFNGPVRDASLAAVRATGAQPLHYVAHDGYLVWAGAAARTQLDQLAAEGTIVVYAAPYDAGLKMIEGDHVASQDTVGRVEVVIQLLRHAGDAASKRIIEGLAGQSQGHWAKVLHYQNLRASLPLQAVQRVAQLPDVIWIEPYSAPERHDERQAQIVAGNWDTTGTAPLGPGYLPWLREKDFSEDPARYPVIDITDDGIGNGDASAAAGDWTFRVQGTNEGASRLAYLNDCTSEEDSGGPDGHGHLNASIAGGMSGRSGAPHEDLVGYQRGLGINPFGRLAGTRVFNNVGPGQFDLSRCDDSYTGLIRQSYRAGARIVNNSWGCSSCGYNDASQAYDTAVRDADPDMPGNQELLILFSAGNNGQPSSTSLVGTVGSPANGKNVIAVGATENVQPGWKDGCGFGPADADNLQEIASYSSRGPGAGGQVKPDFVAPGTHIVGTASTYPWYDGSAICDIYHPPGQQMYAASTGTSHSVPAVAGIASLATYWLDENYEIAPPSPALLRAFLAANTAYLRGTGDDLPSNNQGFGMPDMSLLFGSTASLLIEQGQPPQFTDTGQSWSATVEPADRDLPMRVVLAYTDEPGLLSAEASLINDLDLEVRAGTESYLGNVMAGQWSTTGGTADKVNNMEAVFLPSTATGTYEITVRAARIGGDGVPNNADDTDQDFALVCNNCREKPFVPIYYSFLPVFAH